MTLLCIVCSQIVANKGGLVCKIKVRGTTLCFISCHLQAHEGADHRARRTASCAEILSGARLGNNRRVSKHTLSCNEVCCAAVLVSSVVASVYENAFVRLDTHWFCLRHVALHTCTQLSPCCTLLLCHGTTTASPLYVHNVADCC
jgi:hypothetical protein